MSLFEFDGPTIIYCLTRKQTETVYNVLKHNQFSVGFYHAGLNNTKRSDIMQLFLTDKINCVVATVAFGMGIDKPDIRNVIHYGAPRTIESYYQEIGRAGRDGENSKIFTFWNQKDFTTHRFMINKIQDLTYRTCTEGLQNDQ